MNKHIFTFLLPILLVLLAGCRSEGTAQPTPTHYWTTLEAYERIRPAMLAWHEDAVVVYVHGLSGKRSAWRIRADGRGPWWGFVVQSPSALKETQITLEDDEVIVGVDRITGKEFPISSAEEILPLDEMIDSDEAVEIALRNGVSTNDILEDIHTNRYDGAAGRVIPLSWELTYSPPHEGASRRRIFINAVTGEVIRNDFAE